MQHANITFHQNISFLFSAYESVKQFDINAVNQTVPMMYNAMIAIAKSRFRPQGKIKLEETQPEKLNWKPQTPSAEL